MEKLTSGTPSRSMEEKFESIRGILKDSIDNKQTPCCALLVAQNGKVLFEEAYGLSDLEKQSPCTEDTLFLIASTTKTFTAVTIMALAREGKISLDDPISKYLPEFGKLKIQGEGSGAPSPTIRQCLSHTSGIFGNTEASPTQTQPLRDTDLTIAEAVSLVAKEDLKAQPGSRSSYSGAGLEVASRVAEKVEGKSFDQVMQQKLLDPLGLEDTTFKPNGDQISRIATNYMPGKNGFQIQLKPGFRATKSPKLILVEGGLVSSQRNLATFGQMILSQGKFGSTSVLSPALTDEMRKDHTKNVTDRSQTDPYPGRNYGLGCVIERVRPDGLAGAISHTGLYGTILFVDFDRDLVLAFNANIPQRLAAVMQKPILDIVMDMFPGPKTGLALPTPRVSPAPITGPPTIIQFDVTSSELKAGDSTNIIWDVYGAASVTIEPHIGNVSRWRVVDQIKGTKTVTPSNTVTYTLTATNPMGDVSKSIIVKVE